MMPAVGDKILVTTDNWFYAPDGAQYRAAFGTVHAVSTAEDTLGVRPNGKSTNWYMQVGCLTIAGCQVHYVVKTDTCNLGRAKDWAHHDGACTEYERNSVIFDADGAS